MKARNVYFFFPPASVPLVLAEAHLSFVRFTESGRMIEPHPHSFIHLFFYAIGNGASPEARDLTALLTP